MAHSLSGTGLLDVPGERWNGHCGQDADDRYDDHQFDEGETLLD
jgi:hypothetical protein